MKTLVAAGGVAANLKLRELLRQSIESIDGELYFPRLEFCTDNGAMIAFAGALRLAANKSGEEASGDEVVVRPRWPLSEMQPPL